ncbi:MAG TPA: phosphotransferase [Pseudolysinimonas sp.]|nr:phosphotransferase [Pseudolysinimonas sp.]
MALLLDELAEPFVPIDPDAARAALAEHWGIDVGELTRLDTERDDTFRAGDVTLKIAHPNDAPELIEMQSAALDHVRATDPGVPVQRVVPTTGGTASARIDGRIARVLTWVDGDLLIDSPTSPARLEDAGRMLGRLNRAMSGFAHPGAHRGLAWDLPHLPELRPHTTDQLHLDVIDRFAREVSPVLNDLPHQVIHNDGHPGNLLVRGERVVGILDFGDAVYSARVCELAVALTYLVPDGPRPWPDVEAFTAGYLSAVALTDAELALLPMLVAARTIMRSVINQVLHRDAHTDPHGFYARNDRKLLHLLEGT